MIVNLTETFPKDINGNYTGLKSSSNQSKKYYHFAESPSKSIKSHESQSSNNNEPSKGVKNVLLGPPSEATVINCSTNYQNDAENVTKTLVIDDENLYQSSKLNHLFHQHINRSDKTIGHTVSVSTCDCCGTESNPIVNDTTYSTRINKPIGRDSQIDSSSSRSTPIRDHYQNNSSIAKKLMNGSLSSSPRIEKSLRLKGCHICKKYKQSSPSSLSLTSSTKKITDNCPYSIVFDSFHPVIKPYRLNYRPGNGSNQSTGSKEETRRALIMIFTITSILLFLMITYYGAIIYLRMKNINSK